MKVDKSFSGVSRYYINLSGIEGWKWRCRWAKIILDEGGGFWTMMVRADCGTFAYSWNDESPHRTFKELLLNIKSNERSYLLEKISSKTKFSFEESMDKLKRKIIDARRDGENKEKCRKAWEDLSEIEEVDSADIFAFQCYNHYVLGDFFDWEFGVVTHYPQGDETFVDLFFEIFQPILRRELQGLKYADQSAMQEAGAYAT